MFSRTFLKGLVFKLPILKKFYVNWRLKNERDLYKLDSPELSEYLEEADKIYLNRILPNSYIVGLVKDGHEYDGFVKERAYYPKYERFLKNNNIRYEYYDILSSTWIEDAKKFHYIIWHTDSDPSTQEIALNKIYVLDKLLGIKCLPSFDELWSYEDKINMHYLYRVNNLPEIPTFVTHKKNDALNYIQKCNYPLISKLTTGSSSFGVVKVNNYKQAKRLVNRAFSYKGAKTYFPYQRQKDYILFQEFMIDATYDLRIMVVGDKLLGYYRFPNKGDFKASGAGNYEKKEIPSDVLELAYKVKNIFGSSFLATDFLYSKMSNKYYIIESSIFIGVDTPRQLEINGIAGYYERVSENNFVFKEGKVWVQELVLKEIL